MNISNHQIANYRLSEEKLKRRSDAVLSDIDRDKYIITSSDEDFRKDPKFLCRAMAIDRGILKHIDYDFQLAFSMVKIDYRIWDYIKPEYQREPTMIMLMNCRAPKYYVGDYQVRRSIENEKWRVYFPMLAWHRKYVNRGKGLK